MKNFVIIFIAIISITKIKAQSQYEIIDNMNDNKLNWEEYFYKDHSNTFIDGYMILENKIEEDGAYCTTDLPLYLERNFEISTNVIVSKIDKKHEFGILFDFEDDHNFSSFILSEGHCKIQNYKNGTPSTVKQMDIILKSGRNKNIKIDIERKGSKLIFSVDDMEFVSITKKIINYTAFGYIVYDKNEIKIDLLKIHQINN